MSDTYSWTWEAPKGYAGKPPTIEFRDGKMYVQMDAFQLVDPTDEEMTSLGFKKKYYDSVVISMMPKPRLDPLAPPLINEILAERHRQDELWGVQHHPSFPEMVDTPVARSIQASISEAMARLVELVRATVDISSGDQRAWAIILLEEIFEAMEKPNDWQACRKELIQCAAVILNWVNDADEREVALEERSSDHA